MNYLPRSDSTLDKLTHGGMLARNTVLSLIGQGVPILAAIVAIPLLIKGLGTDRFGVLTLVWLVMGYFSIFDLGLGRALTQIVSAKLGAEEHQEIQTIIWTALLMIMAMGLLGAATLILSAPWLVGAVLTISPGLQAEALTSFYLMAVSLPLVISSSSLRGVLEAHQRFDLTNAVGGVMGVYSFLAPLLALSFSSQLPFIVACLLVGRLFSWGAYFLFCRRAVPSLRQGIIFRPSWLWPLISFGGWITLTNIVGPLMLYLDRFLISGLVSVAAVAYYATPFELVTKLWLIPGALAGVLFPALAASVFEDRKRANQLFERGVKYLFLLMFPLTLVILVFAQEVLTVWLGADFAAHGTRVLQWLTIGVFINSLAWIPSALIQSAGRPDLVAKLHILEFPLYLFVLIWATKAYGIIGAASIWVLRVALDAVIMFYLGQKIFTPESLGLRNLFLAFGGALIIWALAAQLPNVSIKIAFLGLTLVLFALMAWLLILNANEKDWMHKNLNVFSRITPGRSFGK